MAYPCLRLPVRDNTNFDLHLSTARLGTEKARDFHHALLP